MKTCGTCKHWDKQLGYPGGCCRKNPPQQMVEYNYNNEFNHEANETFVDHVYVQPSNPACSQHGKKPVSMRDRVSAQYTCNGVTVTEIKGSKPLGFRAIHED